MWAQQGHDGRKAALAVRRRCREAIETVSNERALVAGASVTRMARDACRVEMTRV
jgi:hypothetical protein